MNIKFFKFVLASLFLAGIFSACEKEDPEPQLPYEEVFGQWEWYSTTTGWGVTTFADSVSYTQALKITEQGRYTWTRADTTFMEDDFIVQVDTIEGTPQYMFDFQESDMVNQIFRVQQKDTLHLQVNCADCDTHLFIRK